MAPSRGNASIVDPNRVLPVLPSRAGTLQLCNKRHHEYRVDDDVGIAILPLGDDATYADELAAKTMPRPLPIGYQR